MPARPKPRLAQVDPPGPSAESLAVCGYWHAVGAVKRADAAFLIGKSVRYIDDLIKAGRIKNTFPHGRELMVPMSAIALYLAEVRDHPEEQTAYARTVELLRAVRTRPKRRRDRATA